MKLTRDAILGGDFSQAVDGWHRGDVLRHLNAIAAAVEELQDDAGPTEPAVDESTREEAEALVQAARAEANAIRAKAGEDAEQQIANAQLAVKDLLERVASLNLGVEEARRAVAERGEEMASRIEESAAPFVDSMRERAEALGAEVDLMATGLAVSTRGEAEAEAEAEPEPEPEPEADAGTGLAPGDVEDAVSELEEETPAAEPDGNGAPAGLERARLVALNMALGGVPPEEAEQRLRDDLGIDDPEEILDDAYGRS